MTGKPLAYRKDQNANRAAVLKVLTASPSVTVRDLAAKVGCGLGTAQFHIKALEADGLIRRADCRCCGAEGWFPGPESVEGQVWGSNTVTATTGTRWPGVVSEWPRSPPGRPS